MNAYRLMRPRPLREELGRSMVLLLAYYAALAGALVRDQRLGSSDRDCFWAAVDMPILLNTFEYVVRGALLGSWKWMNENAGVQSRVPESSGASEVSVAFAPAASADGSSPCTTTAARGASSAMRVISHQLQIAFGP